jgi:hypothetical protein
MIESLVARYYLCILIPLPLWQSKSTIRPGV